MYPKCCGFRLAGPRSGKAASILASPTSGTASAPCCGLWSRRCGRSIPLRAFHPAAFQNESPRRKLRADETPLAASACSAAAPAPAPIRGASRETAVRSACFDGRTAPALSNHLARTWSCPEYGSARGVREVTKEQEHRLFLRLLKSS